MNWLNTSTGRTPAYKFDEQGEFQLWEPSDPGYNADNRFRNSRAFYFLPSRDEWHKAAYYDPMTDRYFDYPTGSDTVPDGIDFVGDPDFEAVFFDGGANSDPNDITDVGLSSPFGTAGQGGNVREWEESAFVRTNALPEAERNASGGTWVTPSNVWQLSIGESGLTRASKGILSVLESLVFQNPLPESSHWQV